jgi:hypothetical protein
MHISATKIVYLLVTISAWTLLLRPSYAQPSELRQEIQQALQNGDTSFAHKDVNGCLAMLTDDFQGTDINGEHFNKAQTRKSLIKEFSSDPYLIISHSISSRIVGVMPAGRKASVLYHEHLATILVEKSMLHRHVLTLDGLRRSIWVKTRDGWRVQREIQVTSRITQDGILKSVQDKQ